MIHFAQLFQSATDGDRSARVRLHLENVLVPELELVLGEHLAAPVSIVPAELDDAGMGVFVDGWTPSERAAARRIMDAAGSGSPLVSMDEELDATELLRDALADGVEMVERRIAQLHLDILARDLREQSPTAA